MPSVQAPHGIETKATAIAGTTVAISAAGWSWSTGSLAAADSAVITAHGAGVVMTWDGTTPTATVGLLIPAGASVRLLGNRNVQAVKLIQQSGVSATVSITLEKYS